ncbi:MAG TPA: histidine kinase dimerization/phospho-acceptor domain-containing protein, partial [Gammaproteobacteria bacterium]
MIRLFFHLYLAVFFPLLVLMLLPVNPLMPLIDRWVEVLTEEQYRGTFYLLEQELQALPQQQWAAHVKVLNEGFGRKLYLVRLDDTNISEATRQALLSSGHAYLSTPIHQAWSRVGRSDYALVLALDETLEERGHRNAVGTAQLIRHHLQQFDDPMVGMRKLASHFGFPLLLRHESELHLEASQWSRLHEGRMVRVVPKPGSEMIYGLLGRADWVIVAGPLDDHGLSERAQLLFALAPATLLALAVLFWLRPLWRDLQRLNGTASRFGAGELAVRSQLPRRSTLTLLATTFNGMAESIQRLIEGQKELSHAVSHEFKTPVARLRFALEMLRDAPSESERQRYLRSVENDLDELETLIGELLSHARYDRPDLALNLRPVDLTEWLLRRVADHRRGNPRLNIGVEAAVLPQRVVMDEKAMDKLLNNLLSNATRYARSQIQVSVMAADGAVMMSV